MSQPNRLPPYARRLIHIMSSPAEYSQYAGTSVNGQYLTVWVLVGMDAWAKGNELKNGKKLFIVIPPGESPIKFRFDYLVGHDPVLLLSCGHVDKHTIDFTVTSLMRDGVQRVLFIGEEGTIRFSKEGAHNVI